MRESILEGKLLRGVKAAGGLCIKLPSIWYRGVPDRMVLLPGGRVYFVELKAVRGRVSVHQVRFQTFLQSLGFTSVIIRGESELLSFLEAYVQSSVPRPSRRARREVP